MEYFRQSLSAIYSRQSSSTVSRGHWLSWNNSNTPILGKIVYFPATINIPKISEIS